jgi:NADPH2:quinone reductase
MPNGGYAEYALALPQATFRVPDGIDDDQAITLLLQGMTAWHLCHTCARVQPGDSVAVGAAAGGVGTIAIQLARLAGAHPVVASAGTEEKRALALKLGADRAVDSHSEDLGAALVEANGGEPLDVIFEMVGGSVFQSCVRALAPFGRLVSYGSASGEPIELTGELLTGSRSVSGFWLADAVARGGSERVMSALFEHLRKGELELVLGATYPLADARQAHVDLESRQTAGKLLLDPSA